MPQLVPIALAAWVPITLALFWALPPRRAAWICLLGGWLLLPTARFDDAVAAIEFPYWIMPAGLPGSAWFTKAQVIGASCLLGIAAFDGGRLRAFRPRWVNLPVAAWSLCPIASAAANGLPMGEGLADAGYLAMAWGVPYLAGRLYFAGPGGMVELARGIVNAGVAYIPFSLAESLASPWLYRAAYGFHPYESPGKERYIGYRPIGFLEDGNQLGIWAATAAVSAIWLWRSGLLKTWRGLNGGAVAALLGAVALATQSVGAIASANLVLVRAGDSEAGQPDLAGRGGARGNDRAGRPAGGERGRRQGPGAEDRDRPVTDRGVGAGRPAFVRLATPGRGAWRHASP